LQRAAPRAEDVCTQAHQGSKPFLGSKTVVPSKLASLRASGPEARVLGHLSVGVPSSDVGQVLESLPPPSLTPLLTFLANYDCSCRRVLTPRQQKQPAQLQHLPQDRLPPQQHAQQQCNKMHEERAHKRDSGKSSNEPVVDMKRSIGAAQKSTHSLSSWEIAAAERQHEGGTSDFNETLQDLEKNMEQESNDNEVEIKITS